MNVFRFPVDAGMFALVGSTEFQLVDTKRMTPILHVSPLAKVQNFNCIDWNPYKNNVIASKLFVWSQSILICCFFCVIAGHDGSTVCLFDTNTRTHITNFVHFSPVEHSQKSGSITQLAWHPLDPDCLFVATSLGDISIYDHRCLRKPIINYTNDEISSKTTLSMAFTPDNLSLVTCHGRPLQLNIFDIRKSSFVPRSTNFQSLPRVGFSQRSGFIRLQMLVTNNEVYFPNCTEHGNPVLVYDISSGMQIYDRLKYDLLYDSQSGIPLAWGQANSKTVISNNGTRTGIEGDPFIVYANSHLVALQTMRHRKPNIRRNIDDQDNWSP